MNRSIRLNVMVGELSVSPYPGMSGRPAARNTRSAGTGSAAPPDPRVLIRGPDTPRSRRPVSAGSAVPTAASTFS